MESSATLKLVNISDSRPDAIAWVELNRPDRANAFNAEMIDDLNQHFEFIAQTSNIRMVVLCAKGKNFSGGADLDWMKASSDLGRQENIDDAKKLQAVFCKLKNLSIPTLACVQGACFGGAVGLVAACDVVIADERAKFCLSETRIGLIPAMIWPFLAETMTPGFLRAMACSASVFSSNDAYIHGLVHLIQPKDTLDSAVQNKVNELLTVSPAAINALKSMIDSSHSNHWSIESEEFCHAIADVRTSAEGQAGLQSFLNKHEPSWKIEWNGNLS